MAYVRVSAVMGREELISPELQLHEITNFAARHGLTVVHTIQDIDVSGRSFTKRRVGEIIDGLKSGKWQYILLWKWSRWGRNLQSSLTYLAAVEQAGGVVRAATEDFDPTTTMGKFTRDQMLLIAELQSNQIGDSWREAHAKRRREGLPHTSARRFGYRYSRATGYVIDHTEAALLADAYRSYATGEGIRSIVIAWNRQGVQSARGAAWTETTLRLLLDNGFAAGWIRERSDTKAHRRTAAEFDIWRKGAHDPIISQELWQAYKAKRVELSRMPVRWRYATHALSGLLTCGHSDCGRPMTATYTGRVRALNWRCRWAFETKLHPPNSLSDARAQHEVLSWIERESAVPSDLDLEVRRQAELLNTTDEIEALQRQLATLASKRKRLADAYTDGKIDDEDYQEQRHSIKAQAEHISRDLAKAEARAGSHDATALQSFRTLRDEWPHLSSLGRNNALRLVIGRIIIIPGPYGPEKVEVISAWDE